MGHLVLAVGIKELELRRGELCLVAGGCEPHVDRLQHGEGPAVHGDVLGGGQEVEEGEHDGQPGDVWLLVLVLA